MGIIGDSLEVLGLMQKAANAEVYEKLGKLVDEIRELYGERERLEEENRNLREQLKFKGTFIRDGRHIYVEGDDTPICSRCADVDNRPVHLVEQHVANTGKTAVCPQCKNPHGYFRKRAQGSEGQSS